MKIQLTNFNFKAQPPNYEKIDDFMSRSAQPEPDDFIWLKEQGVTDIINFRTHSSGRSKCFDEEVIAKSCGIKYHSLPSNSLYPEESKVFDFLDMIREIAFNKDRKVHIHCMHGADRTGLYAFIYKSLKGIGTMQENKADWIRHGLNQEKYPNLMDWGVKMLCKLKCSKYNRSLKYGHNI